MYPLSYQDRIYYLVAAVMHAVRSTDIAILSYVSSFFSIATLLILILLGLAFFQSVDHVIPLAFYYERISDGFLR